MAFDTREPEPIEGNARLRGRLSRLRRLLRSAETFLEHALDELDRMTHDGLAAAPGREFDCRVGRPLRLATVLPIATTFSLDGPSRASWFVAGVERRLQLSPVRLDLLRLLAEPTTTAADGVVEFKAPAAIVHALRARGWHATRRSVIVEIARLRVALGHGGRELIETRRGLGYRFRVLQPRATDQPCA